VVLDEVVEHTPLRSLALALVLRARARAPAPPSPRRRSGPAEIVEGEAADQEAEQHDEDRRRAHGARAMA